MNTTTPFVTLMDDVFLLIIEQVLDEEDPALVSILNKHRLTMKIKFPGEMSGQLGPELHNPPQNYREYNEDMSNEPQNTAGMQRDSFGYHHVLKLRLLCKTVQKRIDSLPFIAIRKDVDKFYRDNVAPNPARDFIMLGIKSEMQIAELRQKWPRMLHDYLLNSTVKDKSVLEKQFQALHNKAKFVYNERCEDYNGKVYGKASYLELEFTGINGEPLTIQVKLVHCWDVREYNWYTQIFIYALNKDLPAKWRPKKMSKKQLRTPPPPPTNSLMQLWKDRGWLDLAYYSDTLAKSVCQDLSLDPSFWANENSCLLLEFFLLVAGESKFTHFVPIAMKNDKSEVRSQPYNWQMVFEQEREPKNGDKSYLSVVNEFKVKFLQDKISARKQGQRYLLNAKIQLGASDVEHSLKTSKEPIAKYIESISHIYDIEVSPGEFAHLNSFFMKATLNTPDGGSLIVWLSEKVGNGYHSPCEYVTLQVMPMNETSAQALKIGLRKTAVVYYHFFNQQVIVETKLCQKLIQHLGSILTPENPKTDKKRKAESAAKTNRPAKKRRTDQGSVNEEAGPEVNFITLFDALLKVRFLVFRRMGTFDEASYFQGQERPGFSYEHICADWKIPRPSNTWW